MAEYEELGRNVAVSDDSQASDDKEHDNHSEDLKEDGEIDLAAPNKKSMVISDSEDDDSDGEN
jgi:hypothetical protein